MSKRSKRYQGPCECADPLHTAAPEMLAALQAVVATIDYHNQHDPEWFVQSMWDARVDILKILDRIEKVECLAERLKD